jgi:MFS family permease
MQSAQLAGIVVGAMLGGFVADAFGLRAPLASYVIPSTLACVLGLTLVEPPAVTPSPERRYFSILFDGLRFVRTHPVLLAFGIELALAHGLIRAIIWLYQPLLAADGMPIKYFGLVHAAAALGQIALLGSVDRIDRVLGSRRKLLMGGGVIVGLGFIALALSSTLAITVVLIVTVFTFGMSRAPLYSAYMHHYVPSENRATVMSAFSMIRMLAVVVVSVIVGTSADWSMPITLVAIGIALVAVVLLTRIEEGHLVDARVEET